MGKTNRMQKRFLERKGKEVMETAMVKEAKKIATEERMRSFAWKRATQFLVVVVICMGLALAASIYAAYIFKAAKDALPICK